MTPSAIRKLIVAEGKLRGNGALLYVDDVDGVSYVTDSYWAAPVTGPLRELFTRHNLTGDEPGTYRVSTTTVTPDVELSQRRAIIAPLVAAHREAAKVALVPVQVAKRPAYILDRDRLLAVFARPDGGQVALSVNFLNLVVGDAWAELAGGELVMEQAEPKVSPHQAGPALPPVGIQRVTTRTGAYANGERKVCSERSDLVLIMPVWL